MQILPFQEEFLPSAVALFVQNFQKQRRAVPILPDGMEDIQRVATMLGRLFKTCKGATAIEDGRLMGYIGWYIVDGFRGTEQRGAYCPVWAHTAVDQSKTTVYRALYRAAATEWVLAGCKVHAITLLAEDVESQNAWFWNGFGLTVVDALRPLRPLDITYPEDVIIRKAIVEDAGVIAAIDEEHWRHYTLPPVLMPPHKAKTAEANREFLKAPHNSIWLATTGGEVMGFLRFEARGEGASEIVISETTVAITGAFTRSAFRGRKAAQALLDAALKWYRSQGFERCSVDFESFNPEAAQFWMKYFQPVCFSVVRHPEA